MDKVRDAKAVSWACEPVNAERDLGFLPAAPLQQRVDETAAWYREQKWL